MRTRQPAKAAPPSRASTLSARFRLTHPTPESTSFGIYGVIIGAGVMTASHAESTLHLVTAVLVTLTIYWAAERYSRLVADRIHAGHRPDWRRLRAQLATGWEIVTASMLPLGVLVAVRAAGVPLPQAVMWALVSSTLLLCLAGWEVGRHGQLTTLERIASASVAGAFGAVMIVLKASLH